MLVLMFKNIKDDPTEYSDLLITWVQLFQTIFITKMVQYKIFQIMFLTPFYEKIHINLNHSRKKKIEK